MASGVWDQIAGKWKQLTGEIRSKWGDLTDDDIEQAAGERDKFVGKIQERYGIAKKDAEDEVDSWLSSRKDS